MGGGQELTPKFHVELIEKNKAHYYRVNNQDILYPGVTTILSIISKPFLIPWAAKEAANKIKEYLKANAVNRPLSIEEIDDLVEAGRKQHVVKKDQAADIGTRAHKAIDNIIATGDVAAVVDKDVIPCVEAFLEWRANAKIDIRFGDTKIANMNFGYGGSLDCLGFDKNGNPVLIDFKTSNYINEEYAYQVAAYIYAFLDTYGVLPMKAIILRLGKTKPEFEVKEVKDTHIRFGAFLNAKNLYDDMKEEKFAEIPSPEAAAA